MTTRKSFLFCVGFPVIGVIIGLLISYNITPEKTPHHTSTVSGSSGELKCTTSCVIEKQ